MTMDHSSPPARQSGRRARTAAAAVAVAALALVVTASALAAHPKAGRRYRGSTSETPIEGFAAPVSFKVAANGKRLLHFTYGSLGCQGAGGFRPGVNPFKGNLLVPVGTLSVSRSGGFSVKNAMHKVATTGGVPTTTTTITSVTGRFSSATAAAGKIVFSQRYVQPHQHFGCGPATITFSVKLH
jgi:hypothetical protein